MIYVERVTCTREKKLERCIYEKVKWTLFRSVMFMFPLRFQQIVKREVCGLLAA